MKKIASTLALLSFSLLIINCQNTPTSSSPGKPSPSEASQAKWTDALVTLFKTKCEEGLNADKSVADTIDVKGACTCSSDEIGKKYPDGAQRFTGEISAEDQKVLEEIGKECALKNVKK